MSRRGRFALASAVIALALVAAALPVLVPRVQQRYWLSRVEDPEALVRARARRALLRLPEPLRTESLPRIVAARLREELRADACLVVVGPGIEIFGIDH